jgi:Uma2 family endonuclease
MSAATLSPPSPTPDSLFRIHLDTYHRMIDLGLLTPRDKVVLSQGLLVKTMSKGPRHVTATARVIAALLPALPAGWFLRKEDPITLPLAPDGFGSEPEPDVAVVRGTTADYADRHPGPADIRLIVEVADSFLKEDRDGLMQLAWENIPVVWIINLRDRNVEVYTEPIAAGRESRYRQCAIKRDGDVLEVNFADFNIVGVRVDDLLV